MLAVVAITNRRVDLALLGDRTRSMVGRYLSANVVACEDPATDDTRISNCAWYTCSRTLTFATVLLNSNQLHVVAIFG